MDDALLVRGLQAVANLNPDVQQLRQRKRVLLRCSSSRQPVAQILPLQQLHHYEGTAFMLSKLVDRADIGVVKGGSGASFATEALQRPRIVAQLFGQELQRDSAA